MSLASARHGDFFHDGHRLEYTEFGSGDRWVVLIHGQLMPRRMHEPLARALADAGNHVITVDLLGHGTSDRPTDPKLYSMSDFARQVIDLLDVGRGGEGGHRRHVAGRERLARGRRHAS